LSLGPVEYGQSGEEVKIKGINANTVGWIHTHFNGVNPSGRDRDISRGVDDAFKNSPLKGHTMISYVKKMPTGGITLYNGANPKDSKGHDRMIAAAACP
jgi:hypothetical protein